MTSCEQRLITKEHIPTHTNLFLWFNSILRYISDKTFKVRNIKYCNTTSQSVFCKLRDAHDTPTFKTEVLRIVSNVQLVKDFYCKMNGKYSITLLFFNSN